MNDEGREEREKGGGKGRARVAFLSLSLSLSSPQRGFMQRREFVQCGSHTKRVNEVFTSYSEGVISVLLQSPPQDEVGKSREVPSFSLAHSLAHSRSLSLTLSSLSLLLVVSLRHPHIVSSGERKRRRRVKQSCKDFWMKCAPHGS